MNAVDRCKAKLEALTELTNRIDGHSARMEKICAAEISAIDDEIALAPKSVASVLKDYRKRLERARKIFLVDEVDA